LKTARQDKRLPMVGTGWSNKHSSYGVRPPQNSQQW
jgi:hypothetical protein